MASISSRPHSIASAGKSMDTTSARMMALVNQDILQLIFSYFRAVVDPGNTTKLNKLVLFRAALTCKAFMEPALDVLWWSMTSLIPVLKLLRNFQVVEGTIETYAFCDNFSDQDWTRFDYYSKRVRDFHYHAAPTHQISATALIRLAQHRRIIYPHLQKVVWSTALSPSAIFLMAPTLESLDVQNSLDDPDIMTTLVSTILSSLPQSLTSIALRGSVSAACRALVPKMTSLSTVIIPDLNVSGSSELLHQLGAWGSLENLHISLWRSTTERLTFPNNIGFPTLRVLCISGQLGSIRNFVAAVTSNQVVSISVSSDCIDTTGVGIRRPKPKLPQRQLDFPGFLCSLTTRWPHLSRLDFDLSNPSQNPGISLHTLLNPIQNRSLIESIFIRGFSRIPCSDQDLTDIGSTLPKAQALGIPFSPYQNNSPTIFGLQSLAQLCPDLTSLQLSIDTRELPTLTNKLLTHGLKTLSVGNSPIEDEFLVAAHLDCLFPYLEKISGIDSTPNAAEHRGWKLVEKILHSCQEARRIGECRRVRQINCGATVN
ncbi:hypothetical protein BD779DRAFT_642684 [Infundibulicybe gibba]|nr:hypothetical protein BD779DRAFT_642684 [Infundibulicybe gibba]